MFLPRPPVGSGMTDVAIVGGGVVGTSVAYHLRGSDLDVTLYEKSALGAATTAASMAIFMWEPDGPAVADLRQRAWREYAALFDEGAVTFTRTGSLRVAETESHVEALESVRSGLGRHDRSATLCTSEEVAPLGLDPGSVVAALHSPEDGYLDAAEAVDHYVEGAREAGVDVEVGEAVTDVLVEDGSVAGVEVAGEPREADVVVNAAGPWAGRIDAMAGVSLPLRHTRGPILALDAEETARPPFAIFERNTYARPFGESGLYVGHYATDYDDAEVVDPDDPRSVDDWFREAARETVETFLPGFEDARTVDEWVGLRTVTPDGHPVVGETAVDGFLVAAGPTGQGVTFAPVVGQLLAEGVETGSMPPEAAPFAPDRFEGP